MKIIKNFIVLFLVLSVFIYGLLFSLYNEQDIMLDFLFLNSLPVPLSVWSGVLIFVGIALGLLAASTSKIFQGLETRSLRKELKQVKAKLEKIKH